MYYGRAMMPLTLVRVPGPNVTILRCQGDLTLLTAESLRRDLAMLDPTRGDGVVLDLRGVRQVDACGARALVDAGRGKPRALRLLVGEPLAGALSMMGVDRVLSVYRSEGEALQGSERGVVGPSEQSRAAVEHWEALRERVGHAPVEKLLHDLDQMTALCEYDTDSLPRGRRCAFCPLPPSTGSGACCLERTDRLRERLREGDWAAARADITAFLDELEPVLLAA